MVKTITNPNADHIKNIFGEYDAHAKLIERALRVTIIQRENELKKCEDEIERLETENSVLEQQMTLPEIATNSVKLQEVSSKLDANNTRLAELMEMWERLSE